MSNPYRTTPEARSLAWAHGRMTLNRLGAMLAPVVFTAPGHPDFSPMQVAPWHAEPIGAEQTGLMRGLRGDWPCVPFGRADCPADLPVDWTTRTPHDTWGHGYSAHHDWDWLPTDDPHTLSLTIALPPSDPIRRLTRTVRAQPDAAAVDLELCVEARVPCIVPVALHPTLRLDAGRVALDLPRHGPGLTYPVPAEPGRSRLAPDQRFSRLDAVPTTDGPPADLTRFPQPRDSEDLLQVMALDGPVTARYLDCGWALDLDWDRALLPDLMLWVSHRGRLYPPWNGRHLALGVEPVCGVFDLGRVATPPADHPLSARTGLTLTPGQPLVVRSRFSARPLSAAECQP
ncbi:MAG: hypothetical protein RLZZ373_2739 [Pseudomonadota bacterium]